MNSAEVMTPSVPSFCSPGSAAQRLVGDVLPEPLLADLVRRAARCASRAAPASSQHLEADDVVREDLAQLVVDPPHGPALAAGHGHAEGEQVVDAGAPQHAVLAAGVLGDVAADGAGPGAGGVGGEDQAALPRRTPWPPR